MGAKNDGVTIGIDVDFLTRRDAPQRIYDQKVIADYVKDNGYNFIVADFEFDHTYISNCSLDELKGPLQQANLTAKSNDLASITVCKMPASWCLDISNNLIRQKLEMAWQRYVNWTAHIGLSGLLIPFPQNSIVANHARTILSTLSQVPYSAVWQSVLLVNASDQDVLTDTAWKRWHTIRTLCGYASKLLLALEITTILPSDMTLNRWLAEPIAAVVLPVTVFSRNNKGFPVLSKRHQTFIRQLLKRTSYFLITQYDPDSEHAGSVAVYQQYIRHLQNTQPDVGEIERFSVGYQDYLQNPLQPLMDNLEAQTYQVFEQDPVKYELYERAIYRALLDKVKMEDIAHQTTVIMVVGAGPRGPLVDCCLRAAESSKRRVKLYAVEKNPNALVSLHAKQEMTWGDQVTVVYADMRRWNAPEQCDILVSELLGSFGDNELSPECLDGVQRFLKEDGISIPQSYSPFVAPLSSIKLYNEAAAYKEIKHMETPYVVMFRDTWLLDEPQKCWSFDHPTADVASDGPIDNTHNTRYSHTTFTAKENATIHGLAGYFECILYKDVLLSTRPATHSLNMTSWFSIYFPIRSVVRDAEIHVHIWRCSDANKVWYEWSVSNGSEDELSSHGTLIHNNQGKSYHIGL